MDPRNPDHAYDLGFALNKNGNHSEALSVLQRIQRQFPAEREDCSGCRDELARFRQFC